MTLPTYIDLTLICERYRLNPKMTFFEDEPLEVCILKKQLANLSCKCSACDKRSISLSLTEEYKTNDKAVQEEQVAEFPDRLFDTNNNPHNTNVDNLCHNISCAGCYIALNLLKARETRIYKDEETETKTGLSCCDKSTGKCVRFVEKNTSTSSIMKPELTNLDTTHYGKNTNVSGIMKKRSNDHVTFADNYEIPTQDLQAFHGTCFCLENFIDSIRPPLTNW